MLVFQHFKLLSLLHGIFFKNIFVTFLFKIRKSLLCLRVCESGRKCRRQILTIIFVKYVLIITILQLKSQDSSAECFQIDLAQRRVFTLKTSPSGSSFCCKFWLTYWKIFLTPKVCACWRLVRYILGVFFFDLCVGLQFLNEILLELSPPPYLQW